MTLAHSDLIAALRHIRALLGSEIAGLEQDQIRAEQALQLCQCCGLVRAMCPRFEDDIRSQSK